jgi:hypothetical protein
MEGTAGEGEEDVVLEGAHVSDRGNESGVA